MVVSSCFFFVFFYCLTITDWLGKNSPAAQSSSSAPFSQSFSPSHLHDNETHLLADPPQSNFSGGHVCLPVDRDERDGGVTAEVLWAHKCRKKTTTTKTLMTRFLSPGGAVKTDPKLDLSCQLICLGCFYREKSQKDLKTQLMLIWLP